MHRSTPSRQAPAHSAPSAIDRSAPRAAGQAEAATYEAFFADDPMSWLEQAPALAHLLPYRPTARVTA